jgi:hypothetical protein
MQAARRQTSKRVVSRMFLVRHNAIRQQNELNRMLRVRHRTRNGPKSSTVLHGRHNTISHQSELSRARLDLRTHRPRKMRLVRL